MPDTSVSDIRGMFDADFGCLVRGLGSIERLMHLYSGQHPRHFCIAAELGGAVDPDSYVPAFSAVQARHPLLSVCIRDRALGLPSIYRSAAPIEVAVHPSGHGLGWRQIVERELARPFPDDRAPLMRATVLHARDGAAVILTFHHALADGISGVNIVGDLMQALDGRPLPPLAGCASLDMLAAAQASSGSGAPAVASADAIRVEQLRVIGGSALWRPFEGDNPCLRTCILDTGPTSALLTRCRSEATTLHGALCAALAHTAATPGREAPFVVASAVNLRDVVDGGHGGCGLIAGIAPASFQAPERQAFWDLARQTVRDIAPSRTLEGALTAVRTLNAALPPEADGTVASGVFGLFGYDAVVSNLGALPIPVQVGSLRLEAFWGPAVQGRFRNEVVIGAAGVGGRLYLMQTSPAHIGAVLPGMRRRLLAAASETRLA